MQLEDAIKKRKSIRKFSNKKVDWRKILEALDYARFSPMAGNQNSVKFIVVSAKEKIDVIEEACQQKFVGKASYIVLVVSDRNRVKKFYDHYDKGFGAQQAGAAIENFLLGLTEKGLGSCWVGLFDDAIIKREFDIPESTTIEAVLPIGIPDKINPQKDKPKLELSSIVFFDKYGKKYMGDDTLAH